MISTKPKSRTAWIFIGLYCAVLLGAVAMTAGARQNEPEDPRALFRQANQAYSAGNYSQARDLYLQILDQFPNNATVEYNLGNSYARLGDTAQAVLHYERALLSDPRLEDARHNLLQLAPPANHPDVSPLIKPFRWVKHRMNVNEWLWTSFILLTIACLAGAVWALEIKGQVFWRIMSFLFAFLFVLSIGFTASAIGDSLRSYGIVLQNKTMARSGPGENYLEAMELPAGAKVVAAGEPQRGWVKIRTPDGHAAYIRTSDVDWI